MSYSHQITFRCDSCDMNFMINEESMELPPGWLGLQVVVADVDGCVPEHERDVYCHFCSQDCLVEYTSSVELRQRLALADNEEELGESGEEEL